jgi:hypothetical protein
MGGNLTLSYAERSGSHRPGGAAVAVTPLWFLVLDSLLLGDHHISRRGKIGLAIGIAGVVVLIWPDLQHSNSIGHRELWWSLALQLGSFSWAFGSVLSKKWQTAATRSLQRHRVADDFRGDLANLIFALLVEKPANVTWTFSGVGAIAYLVVCGSWIGYTAYIWLLQHVPTSKVSTYAYVNPVVAVFLGWLVLHERIDRYIRNGQRNHRGIGGAGDEREGLDAECGGRFQRSKLREINCSRAPHPRRSLSRVGFHRCVPLRILFDNFRSCCTRPGRAGTPVSPWALTTLPVLPRH